jgi:hypothetical protein
MMTDERLVEIESHLHAANHIELDEHVAVYYRRDVPALLAEIRRLREGIRTEITKADPDGADMWAHVHVDSLRAVLGDDA